MKMSFHWFRHQSWSLNHLSFIALWRNDRLGIKKWFVFLLLKDAGTEWFLWLLKTVLKYCDSVCWIYSIIKQCFSEFSVWTKKNKDWTQNTQHQCNPIHKRTTLQNESVKLMSLNQTNSSVIRSERFSTHWIASLFSRPSPD